MRSILVTVRSCLSMLDGPMKRRWAWLVVLAVVAAILETLGSGAVFGLIGVVADPGLLTKAPLVGPWLDELSKSHPTATLFLVAASVALFFVIKNGFLWLQIYNQEQVAYATTRWVADRLMRGYLHTPYAFHFRRNSAQLIHSLQMSVDDAFRGALQSAVIMLSEGFIALGLVTVLLVSEPTVSLVSALFLGGMMGLALKLTGRTYRAIGQRLLVLGGEVVQAVQQGLGAIKEVKILGREDYFADRFAETHFAQTQEQIKGTVVGQAPRLVTETLMVVGMALIICLVVASDRDRTSVLPVLGLFGYVGFRLQPSLNRIVLYMNNITRSAAAAADLAKDWPSLSAAADRPLSHPAPLPFNEALVVDAVRYAYPGGDRQVLNGVSLTIPRGASVGIVGTSGAGKSTLIDIILGLLSPSDGRVLVDGIDIATDPRAWQRKIGYVPQTIFLIDDTLRRNIAFGLPDREIDDRQLRRAVELAQLAEFVDGLGQGLDSRVGERGLNLSGGQRQRVGIARALYNDPELLVFDEATSALDAETEKEVSRAIDALSGSRTIILIAHRLSTLRNCDTIVLMKDGQIVGIGSHPELVRDNEEFRRMAMLSAMPEPAGQGA